MFNGSYPDDGMSKLLLLQKKKGGKRKPGVYSNGLDPSDDHSIVVISVIGVGVGVGLGVVVVVVVA